MICKGGEKEVSGKKGKKEAGQRVNSLLVCVIGMS